MPLPEKYLRQLAESHAAAEREARKDNWRAWVRVLGEIAFWSLLGLSVIGLAFHTLDFDETPRGMDPRSAPDVKQRIAHVALVVADYDEALAFYTQKLRFTVVEDTYQPAQDKSWVVIAPPGSSGTTLLLARATTPEQARFVGDQAGGRVFLFLETDDFWRDHTDMTAAGVTFVRPPSEQSYGTVAVFEDLYGTRWDLVQFRAPATEP